MPRLKQRQFGEKMYLIVIFNLIKVDFNFVMQNIISCILGVFFVTFNIKRVCNRKSADYKIQAFNTPHSHLKAREIHCIKAKHVCNNITLLDYFCKITVDETSNAVEE